MTDFIRNLVLRGSGLVSPIEVRPTRQPQFPPALIPGRWQTPLPHHTPVKAASTSPRQDADIEQPNKAESNVEMMRSSPTDNGLPAPEMTSPAAFLNQPSYSSARHREPDQILPASVFPPASSQTYPEPTSQMESASNKVDRPHSENKLVESGPFPGQIELHARPTVEPNSGMSVPPGITSRSSQGTERSEVQLVLRSTSGPTPAAQSVGLGYRQVEDQPLESKQSLGKTEASSHQERPPLPPAAALNLHNSVLPMVEPILLPPWQVPAIPGLDNSWTNPVARPSLPVSPDHAMSSPPTVEVHIGTLEVRANQSLSASAPPSAPKPQGFQDYAHLRGWDGE